MYRLIRVHLYNLLKYIHVLMYLHILLTRVLEKCWSLLHRREKNITTGFFTIRETFTHYTITCRKYIYLGRKPDLPLEEVLIAPAQEFQC